jgi:hypothetical protein
MSEYKETWLWRMPSSGMWRRIDLVWTDVSEERIASMQPRAHPGSSLADFPTLKMEAIRSSETLVHIRSRRCHIPEDGILYSHRRENLRYYKTWIFLRILRISFSFFKQNISEVGCVSVNTWKGTCPPLMMKTDPVSEPFCLKKKPRWEMFKITTFRHISCVCFRCVQQVPKCH